MRDAEASPRANAYQKYLEKLESGEPLTPDELSDAFGAVNKRFTANARESGYDIAEVHHWNYPKSDYPDQVFDPRNLFPLDSRGAHTLIHQETTSDPSAPWAGPIAPGSQIPIDSSYYPLAKR